MVDAGGAGFISSFRWELQAARLFADPVSREDVSQGDGHTVLLLPGLRPSERSLRVIAGWLHPRLDISREPPLRSCGH